MWRHVPTSNGYGLFLYCFCKFLSLHVTVPLEYLDTTYHKHLFCFYFITLAGTPLVSHQKMIIHQCTHILFPLVAINPERHQQSVEL